MGMAKFTIGHANDFGGFHSGIIVMMVTLVARQ